MPKPNGGLCSRCGQGLRFVERRQASNGHHNCIYECPGCGREVVSG